MTAPKRVFISYAHESDAHRARVLALAQRLRREGIDAWIDRFAPHQSDWALWMRRELDNADVVLCVCTESWRKRYDAVEDDSGDTGVRYEGRLLRTFLLESQGNAHKVAAVVFSEDDRRRNVPRDLSGGTIYQLDGDYERLYAWLSEQALVEPAPLGKVRPLAAEVTEAEVRSEGVVDRSPAASGSEDALGPPHPPPDGAPVNKVNDKALAAALAKAYPSESSVRALFRSASIDATLVPSFGGATTSRDYWLLVLEQFELGAGGAGALRRLVGAALETHAGNATFLAVGMQLGAAPAQGTPSPTVAPVNPPSPRLPPPAPEPEPTPRTHPIRVLHLSDLHFHADRAWNADPVLAELARSVQQLREQGLGPDLVILTGDVAFSGRKEEYDLARAWLDGRLLPAAGVSAQRCLIVPGNHDVDRDACKTLAVRSLQSALVSSGNQQEVADVLGSEQRDALLARHRAFVEFLSAFHGRPVGLPWWKFTEKIRGVDVHVAGLTSAWLSQGDEDQGKLLVGQWQALHCLEDADEADLVIVAMHHPWGWLAEWDSRAVRPVVLRAAGVMMMGHLHEEEAAYRQTPHEAIIEAAAGACYAHDTFPNTYSLLELDPFAGTATAHARVWAQRKRAWVADTITYPDGPVTFPLRRSRREPAPLPEGD